MLRSILTAVAVCLGILAGSPPAAAEPAEGPPLILPEALARTVREHPELAAFSAEVRAREAEALQAGVRPNPVLALEAENVFGSGEFSGTDAAETTASLSQTLELGDKRRLRRELAEAEVAAAGREYARVRSALVAETRARFQAALAAQERLALAGELAELAARDLATVEERIAAGKAAATERIRARIALADLRLVQANARDALRATRRALAAGIGSAQIDFGPLRGELAELPQLPPLAELEDRIAASPDLARRLAETEARRRDVALERARRLPDIEVGVGARYLRQSEDTAMVLGLSVPLPLFDRNRGGIAAAESRLSRARLEERTALLQAQAALTGAWEEAAAARREAEALRQEILPAATDALEAIEYGYRAGKFGILDLLDARRTLIEARGRYLDALLSAHRAAGEIERLAGSDPPPTVQPVAVSDKE